LGYLNVEAA